MRDDDEGIIIYIFILQFRSFHSIAHHCLLLPKDHSSDPGSLLQRVSQFIPQLARSNEELFKQMEQSGDGADRFRIDRNLIGEEEEEGDEDVRADGGDQDEEEEEIDGPYVQFVCNDNVLM